MENNYLKLENNSGKLVPNSKIQGLNLEKIGPLCPKCGGIKSKKNSKGKSVSVPNTPLQTNKNILNVKNDEKKSSNGAAQIFPIEPKNSETVKTKPVEPQQQIIIKQARIKLELKEIDPENEADSEEEEENDLNSMPKGEVFSKNSSNHKMQKNYLTSFLKMPHLQKRNQKNKILSGRIDSSMAKISKYEYGF